MLFKLCYKIENTKMSKGNPFPKWIWETLGVERLTQVPFMNPTSYTHQKKLTLHPLAGKKRFSPCPATTQPMGNYYKSASEKSPQLQALIFL